MWNYFICVKNTATVYSSSTSAVPQRYTSTVPRRYTSTVPQRYFNSTSAVYFNSTSAVYFNSTPAVLQQYLGGLYLSNILLQYLGGTVPVLSWCSDSKLTSVICCTLTAAVPGQLPWAVLPFTILCILYFFTEIVQHVHT